jgi:hypothetical protein
MQHVARQRLTLPDEQRKPGPGPSQRPRAAAQLGLGFRHAATCQCAAPAARPPPSGPGACLHMPVRSARSPSTAVGSRVPGPGLSAAALRLSERTTPLSRSGGALVPSGRAGGGRRGGVGAGKGPKGWVPLRLARPRLVQVGLVEHRDARAELHRRSLALLVSPSVTVRLAGPQPGPRAPKESDRDSESESASGWLAGQSRSRSRPWPGPGQPGRGPLRARPAAAAAPAAGSLRLPGVPA